MTTAMAFSMFSLLSFTKVAGMLALAWMRALLVSFFSLALLLCGSAHAEGGCPPGLIPNNTSAPAGSAESLNSCIPIPSDTQGPTWRTRWGAIASDEEGSFGIVTGVATERKAKKAALSKCAAERGSKSCTLDLAFRNQCAAIVTSGSQAFIQGAPYEEDAIAVGQKRCEESKAAKCWVHYSGCSLPVRAR